MPRAPVVNAECEAVTVLSGGPARRAAKREALRAAKMVGGSGSGVGGAEPERVSHRDAESASASTGEGVGPTSESS
eukprot:CAMPEP_0116873022 /NCGR_PEP_ID=MMETSP0463-20121206/3976_1 /TAXON_ID=181622 /ORGANISM="Strombidinopsis sp, Strain SopsisLIS2011" /LENGTH=75 /DNA_ID=CAMNT_0004514235 /DNA_START=43 /DNA_END=270 /DNA_ORIENTATION=-